MQERTVDISLVSALAQLPPTWILTPVRGKKPYQKGWTKTQLDRFKVWEEIDAGQATGFGLQLGINGLLAVDIDGQSARDLLQKLAGENGIDCLNQTVTWTSGRSHRAQYLFWVPECDRFRLRNLRIPTGVEGDDGKEEGLEFRWLGTQSVLPPSLHPHTQKPYYWERSPGETETLQAPEWLMSVCQNWKPEFSGEDTSDLVRFPARLYSHFRRQLEVWLLAKHFDDSKQIHRGNNKGCGHGSFTLLAASKILDRSKGHIRRLLCEATKSGLIRKYTQHGDWIKVYYTKLEKAIEIAGLSDNLGPVAVIEVDRIKDLNIIATEIEALNLQKLSFYCKRQEEIEQLKQQGKDPNKLPTQLIASGKLLTCENPARVKAKGSRFIYCEPGFKFYGGCQETIAIGRGVSVRTVQRHLSNSYRLVAAPQRGYREGLEPILKRQLAERLPNLKLAGNCEQFSKLLREDGLFWAHQNWWKPRCNIYSLDYRLLSIKRRRVSAKKLLVVPPSKHKQN